MDVGHPYRAVLPSLDDPVLRVLHGTVRQLTGREVHRLSGVGSLGGTQKVLARLVDQGLVFQQEAGSALLFQANRSHLAWPAVDALMTIRARLVERLTEVVAGWALQPTFVGLFGSTARGDGDGSSDVDLLVVSGDDLGADPASPVDERPAEWLDQLAELRDIVQLATGNRAQLVEMTGSAVFDLVDRGERIVAEWRRDLVVVAGELPIVGTGRAAAGAA